MELDEKLKFKDDKIKVLEDFYLKKQHRTEYPDKNVIYILTTEDNKKKRIYIVGKAVDLKNRLGTYNKTCEHEVVHFSSCKCEEDMDLIEKMVLCKLNEYKEKANRDRFVLSENKKIDFFKEIIEQTIKFYYNDKIELEKKLENEIKALPIKKRGRPKINNKI